MGMEVKVQESLWGGGGGLCRTHREHPQCLARYKIDLRPPMLDCQGGGHAGVGPGLWLPWKPRALSVSGRSMEMQACEPSFLLSQLENKTKRAQLVYKQPCSISSPDFKLHQVT